MNTTRYPDSAAGAQAALNDMADERVVARVKDEMAGGYLMWVPDPSVDGVWGLERVVRGHMGEVVAVVYLNGDDPDFECNDVWAFGGLPI